MLILRRFASSKTRRHPPPKLPLRKVALWRPNGPGVGLSRLWSQRGQYEAFGNDRLSFFYRDYFLRSIDDNSIQQPLPLASNPQHPLGNGLSRATLRVSGSTASESSHHMMSPRHRGQGRWQCRTTRRRRRGRRQVMTRTFNSLTPSG